MKKGYTTVGWNKLCSLIVDGRLNVIKLQTRNDVYLIKLAWHFSYSNKPWTILLKARFLSSKYQKVYPHKSSSIWYGIKQFYDLVLEYTCWTVGTSKSINFWNDLWCSPFFLSIFASIPYRERVNLVSNVSQVWNGNSWREFVSLLPFAIFWKTWSFFKMMMCLTRL